MNRRLPLLAALLFLPLALAAQDNSAAVSAALKELKTAPLDATALSRSVPLMADPAGHNSIRTAILTLDPFPSEALFHLLSDPALAVRLGALELLEEKAGSDFSYNPWQPADDPENQAALVRWAHWASVNPASREKKDLLGDEQRRGYLLDLLGNDDDKASRARRMLEADGLASVGFLETFLTTSSATLPTGSRAKVRQAQYQIVLARPLGPQAAATARQLAFGSRDQMLAALATLKGCGLISLPILRDFLQHSDPLVRETAMDAMLSSGGPQSLSLVGPALAAETDVNVIHGALRRLKEIPGDESLRIAAAFLSHEDEDLLVSALQACQKLCGGIIENRHFASNNAHGAAAPATGVQADVNKAVVNALGDPRWRVRTAALEYVTGCRSIEAKDRCLDLLSDPDEFVRFSAIKATAALRAEGAAQGLKEMMIKDPAMTGAVLEGYAALGQAPDAEMLAKLSEFPPDARLAAVRAAESNPSMQPVLLQLAQDADLDVTCAALRSLASDKDQVAEPRIASLLVAALRSGAAEKRTAVLDRLAMSPLKSGIDPELMQAASRYTAAKDGKTALDPIYDSLLGAAGQDKPKAAATPAAQIIPDAEKELVQELTRIAAGDGQDAFRAALCLATADQPAGLTALSARLPQLSTAQRSAIAEKIYAPSKKEALELLRQLLRDPVEEIRTSAASAALSNENAPAFLDMVLEELTRDGARLQPYEVYSYHFESLARQSAATRTMRAWAQSVLDRNSSPDPLRVLALIPLRSGIPATTGALLLSLAKSSPNPWIRRAAWHSLGSSGAAAFRQNLATVAADSSAQVRVVIPESIGRMDSAWEHRFDDIHGSRDNSWSSDRRNHRMPEEAKTLLMKLAEDDPVPEVRFESTFALLSQNQPIDAAAFANLIALQPADSRASYRIGSWMSENLGRLGPGLATVAAALDTSEVQGTTLQKILAATAPKGGGTAYGSFQALVAGAVAVDSAPQQTGPAENSETSTEKPARTSLKVVYFYKPGCTECERAARLLETVKKDFPMLTVEEHNFSEAGGIVLHEALSSRFDVPSSKRVAPALFTQGGFLVGPDIVPQALGKLLSSTMATAQDDSWSVVAEPQIAAAATQVEKKVDSLTLPVVLIAGLADGVNPCAFATIIFFLSYLQVARRTPREMLMVGAAFISAVFLAYFLTGLALSKVLEQIMSRVSGVTRYLDWTFGALAILAAWLSFRDAMKARSGNLDEMTLQLPAFLKTHIRGVIRTGTKARRFVIAAFLVGIVVSFLELACTGQVYAPIIYGIQQGRGDAVVWLLAYNVAFIVPLVIIFFMAFAGISNKKLIDFQTRHTFAVKVALGLVFVALAAMILFREKLMHW
jgi:cytochrome c biogenesis protein CcdA/HEAT repeat protein